MRLLHDATFRNLWAANTISNFGTMFGALTLTALIYLDASPAQMGILAAMTSVPVLLFALAAGVRSHALQTSPSTPPTACSPTTRPILPPAP